MLIVTGWNSRITQELLRLLPANEVTQRSEADFAIPTHAERYLFCAGMIRDKATEFQTAAEMSETVMVNGLAVIRACDKILNANADARICIVGSESGFAWSFDGAYAAAKAAVHRYVETKRLHSPRQQLVAIAPGIISDCGMTLRRDDQERVLLRSAQHPKKRHLTAVEVARLIHFALYVDQGYLSGTVIRLNGGEHTDVRRP